MANPQQGSVLAMKEAVGRYLANSDPNYARAFHRYGLVDDAVSKVRETAQGSAGRSGESLPSEARLSTLPTLAYAGAVNPLWAMIPPIRNIARGVAARNLDKMMSLNSLDEMSAAASKNAQAKWLEHLIRSGLMPIQLGSVDPTGE
jgi:hypothetical protein